MNFQIISHAGLKRFAVMIVPGLTGMALHSL